MRKVAGIRSIPSASASQRKLLSNVLAYRANRFVPGLLLDFENEYYSVDETAVKFDDAVTFSRTGNATMVDSDGLIKWAPHNLVADSNNFTTWNRPTSGTGTIRVITPNFATAPDGSLTASRIVFDAGSGSGSSDYSLVEDPIEGFSNSTPATQKVWLRTESGTATLVLRNGGSLGGNTLLEVTEQWQLFTREGNAFIQFGCYPNVGTSSSATVYAWNAQVHRRDLGGMVDNPDANALDPSYVPTTGSARYLARRGHHKYNGSAWGNEGLLVESEARTNLVLESNDPTGWSTGDRTLTQSAVSPSGETDAWVFAANTAGGTGRPRIIYPSMTVSESTAYTVSWFVKADQTNYIGFRNGNFAIHPVTVYIFDLSTGTPPSIPDADTVSMEDVGNGWWHCAVSYTTNVGETATGLIYLQVTDPTNQVINLDGSSSVLVYGFQFEQAPTPSSYIPTSGSTVTRAGDSLSIPFANTIPASTDLSYSYIGKSTFVDNNAFGALKFYGQNDNENSFVLALNIGAQNRGDFYHRFDQAFNRKPNSVDAGINVPFNLATRSSATELQIAQDGTAKTVSTSSGAAPTLTGDMVIASHVSAASNMTLKLFRGWGADIGTAGIEEASQ